MAAPFRPPVLTPLRSSSVPSSRPTSRKDVADDVWASMWSTGLLTLDSAGMPSPKSIMTSLEGVELATLNLDEDVEAVVAADAVTTTISAQLELLSGSECNVVGAAAILTEMLQRDHHLGQAVQEEIRTAGGVRSAVFLLKLSQTAGNQRIANAASRLLLHLARDNASTAWSKCLLGSAPARLLCLLRTHQVALGNSALPGERPASWARSHCLGRSS